MGQEPRVVPTVGRDLPGILPEGMRGRRGAEKRGIVLPYQRLEHNPQVAELSPSNHKRSKSKGPWHSGERRGAKRRATCRLPAPANSRFHATLGMTNRCRKARGRKARGRKAEEGRGSCSRASSFLSAGLLDFLLR